jgi:Bax protein
MLDAVRSYALLINKNSSYRYIHEKRHKSQEKGTELNGIILAEGLKAYSELGRKYVKTVQSIIKNNQLTKLDDAVLLK